MRVNYKYSITKSIYSYSVGVGVGVGEPVGAIGCMGALGHVVVVTHVDCGCDDDGGAQAHCFQVVWPHLHHCVQAVWVPHCVGRLCAVLIIM